MAPLTKEDIKERYSMADIVGMYGLHPNRAGFCQCPFHKGDRQASLKIYAKDFNCFGCGANGDIFTFVQMMDDMDFKQAYEHLGGTYAKDTESRYVAHLKAYRADKKRQTLKRMEADKRTRICSNNDDISLYRLYLKILMPLSDLWCEVYNKLQYALYMHDILNESR